MKEEYFVAATAALETLIESFEKNVKVPSPDGEVVVRRSRGACATMAIVTPTYTHYCPNQACHAGLNNTSYDGFPIGQNTRVAVISTIQNHKHKRGNVSEFVDYLVNRSMYKDVFASKDVDFIIDKGFICETEVPANLLAGGLIASRRISEYDYVLTGWKYMRDAGVNEDVAFALAHTVSFSAKGVVKQTSSGHCSIDGSNLSLDTVRNMKNHDLKKPLGNYITRTNYSGVHSMFNEDNYRHNNDLHDLMNAVIDKAKVEKVVVKKEVDGVCNNPFKIEAPKRVERAPAVIVRRERFIEELLLALPKEFLND